MPVIEIRRPRYSRRSILYWVQNTANTLSAENDGKVPDVFLLDARLRQQLNDNPELLDIDKYVRDCRKFWERANNKLLTQRDDIIFVPGAYVTVGKRARARMAAMKAPTDIASWLQTDAEARANFNRTMDRRRSYQLDRIKDAAAHPDCPTLGDIECKLYGYVPSPADAVPFPFDEGLDESYEDAAAE